MEFLNDLFNSQPGVIREGAVAVIAGAVAIVAAIALHHILFKLLRRFAKGSGNSTDDVLVRRLARPSRYAFIALGLVLAAREISALEDVWEKIAGFVMPALVGWMALAIMHAFIHAMYERADITVPDNRLARRKRTRLAIFSRIGTALIIFITVGLMLLSIPGVRDIGVTLMASAGLAGLAVGAAAQPALKSLIGGLQMAVTEPIAIDDVVIIDGEWGRIEDIKTTYVVVKIWDERRLVVPTVKFLEHTFQNWTKRGSQLLGFVMIYLDPTTDIGPIRAEFERQIASHHLFDGRVQNVQVTDMTPEAMEVRLLLSATDAQNLWDLRVAIRESMIDWLRREMPESLARQRIQPVAPLKVEGLPPPASLSQD